MNEGLEEGVCPVKCLLWLIRVDGCVVNKDETVDKQGEKVAAIVLLPRGDVSVDFLLGGEQPSDALQGPVQQRDEDKDLRVEDGDAH